MTRQDFLLKWSVYTLALVPVWILDAFLLPRFPLLGAVPSLLPLAVAAIAVLEGSRAGAGFGIGVGLLWVSSYSSGSPSLIFGMALTGFLVGIVSQYVLSQTFPGYLLCSIGLMVCIQLIHALPRLLLTSATSQALMSVAVPELLYSLIFSPLVYFCMHLAFRRVGRDKLV